jgi:hypothetical protein
MTAAAPAERSHLRIGAHSNAVDINSAPVAWILIRGALVVAALVVVAWLAFSLRAVDLQADAESTIARVRGGGIGAGKINEAQRQLHRADRYNPDLTPLLDEGLLLMYAGKTPEAYGVALTSVAKEPENAQAWTLVYLTAPDRGEKVAARRKVQHLNPWLGDTLR